jgi:uncharacterized membrane protein SpoIIM required for sporulation
MTVDRFSAARAQRWSRLDELVTRAKRRPERLGADDVRRLGSLYRSAAADLAIARRRFPSDPVVPRLESLVGRARHLVYDAPSSRGSVRAFVATEYWRAVRERPALLAVAAALLVVPAVLCTVWALHDPGGAAGLVPGQFRAVTERRPGGSLGLSGDAKTALSTQIFTNNIRVAFLAFAGGAAVGIATAGVVILNGVMLGTVLGLAFGSGNGHRFVELVVAHGVLELSCIAVAAAAGLRMAWAIVDPGARRRGSALRDEAARAVMIAVGTAAWLVVAGIVEGFVTPAGLGLGVNAVIGVALGALYWTLVIVRGRPVRTGPVASA